MIKKITILLLLFFAFSSFAQTNRTNHIILVDNTGSMRGKPQRSGNLNIWSDVKQEIIKYISDIDIGDKITLYYFDEDLSKAKILLINSISDRNEAKRYINELNASGLTTCLYTAIFKALRDIEANSDERELIYIFTDFVEACPDENYTIEDIKKKFNTVRSKDYAHLYYISLGKAIPNDIIDWSNDEDDVDATNEVPGKDDLFPKTVAPVKNILTFDFSKNEKVIIQTMPFKTNGNINFDIKLSCEMQGLNNKHVELLTKSLKLIDNLGEFKIKIKDDIYFNDDIEAEIKLYVIEGNVSLAPDIFKVKLILPKKGKSTIKFE